MVIPLSDSDLQCIETALTSVGNSVNCNYQKKDETLPERIEAYQRPREGSFG